MVGVGKNKVANSLSNFSVQYNFTSVSVAIMLLSKQDGTVPDWASSMLTSTVFLGSIVGMLVMGYLGDTIGRRKAMALTLCLTSLGAAGSALLSWGSDDSRYILMAVWRMLMGVGIGGIYPLSSALSFEESVKPKATTLTDEHDTVSKPHKQQHQQQTQQTQYQQLSNGNSHSSTNLQDTMSRAVAAEEEFEEVRNRRRATAWAVFWQQPGQMTPYVVGLLLLLFFDFRQIELQYRTVLVLGALPPLGIVLSWTFDEEMTGPGGWFSGKEMLSLFSLFSSSSSSSSAVSGATNANNNNNNNNNSNTSSSSETQLNKDQPRASLVQTYWRILRDPRYSRRLAGTSLSWMIFDIYAYGVTLYTPEIMKEVFGSSDTMASDYWQNVFAIFTTIPASMLSVYALAGIGSSSSSSSSSSSVPSWVRRGFPTRQVQVIGFFAASASFLVTGLTISFGCSAPVVFAVFLLAKFVSMFGVPTTTFVLPNELFPASVRASCNGVSAAVGKVGAFCGSFLFPYIYDDLGIAYIFYFSTFISLLGVVCTLCFIPPPPPPPPGSGSQLKGDDEDEASSESTPLMMTV